MNYLREASTVWLKDGDSSAYIIRILNTGAANAKYMLKNPLGYVPVGVQIIKKNMPIDCFVSSATIDAITLIFTLKNADVTIRVW